MLLVLKVHYYLGYWSMCKYFYRGFILARVLHGRVLRIHAVCHIIRDKILPFSQNLILFVGVSQSLSLDFFRCRLPKILVEKMFHDYLHLKIPVLS